MPAPEDGAETPAEAENIHKVDARTLRGLAHPLRLRLLAALREYGPATASGLADRLGESSGATSYHLRQLAAYGFVEDDPERGKGRERWWRAAHRGTVFDSSRFLSHPDPEVRGAVDVVLHETATTHSQELSTWIGTMREWPDAWRQEGWDISDFQVRLTPDLSEELIEKIHELIESYRGRVPEGTEGSANVRSHVHLFPRPAE
ncbi:winged helix-turn-helix domain-containing protein [Streptomyces sp. Ncost-T10-10d]|uniref:winged helix-turn-helix domain-containing protein n=1 Tax=Streptomyces sp. Ncost-T10-10d TaxID=1839774 RepID=UPI00081F3AA5|nr:winged helix-turn-helix domain-containing protein [Streptomyces sp. Ncost-T10-10d]SCF97116.1 transcriptional regulator, ArsR family [Streptomyces sp. Ncost-T10-10d]